MARETILLIAGEYQAMVQADVRGGAITTGAPGSGAPNVSHYAATVAGHEVGATWRDDARYPTTAYLPRGHALRRAIELLSRMADAARDLREMRGPRPKGWDAHEWAVEVGKAEREDALAKRRALSDPIAHELHFGRAVAAV